MRLILDGIDLGSIRRRPRFRAAPQAPEKARNPLEVPLGLVDNFSETGPHDVWRQAFLPLATV